MSYDNMAAVEAALATEYDPQPDCSACYRPITGRAVHDRGEPWHHECRQEYIARQAAANADRYIATDVGQAQLLAEIQAAAA